MALAVAVIIAIYLAHISAEDIRTHTISNFAPIIIIAASPFLSELPFADRIIGLLVVFCVLLAANLIANIGMGDVKLCAAFAFVIGTLPELIAVLLALTAAKVFGKWNKRNKEIPLAPSLCAANAVVYVMEVFIHG